MNRIKEISKKISIKNFIDFFTQTKTLFYYCALISSWDDRSWYFLMGIYLVILDPSNLILTAVFGYFSSGIMIILGSFIGSRIDKSSRLKAIYTVIAIRNISTMICSVCLCLVLIFYDQIVLRDQHLLLIRLAQVILILFGICATSAGMVNNIILSRDWLPIFCSKDSQQLSVMLSRFRLIDLVSKIIAPLIIGHIMTFAGKTVAAVIFSIQVMFSLLLMLYILYIIYYRIPRLHFRESTEDSQPIVDENSPIIENQELHNNNDLEYTEIGIKSTSKFLRKLYEFIEGWIIYFKQSILFAGIALSLLYMTVLGLDAVTIGYVVHQGVSELNLSLFNAAAAITGILGTLFFPYVVKWTNIVITGIIGLALQLIGLVPCVLSVWAQGSPFNLESYLPESENISTITTTIAEMTTLQPHISGLSTSIILLMAGIVASRFGLWMFDLTVSQLLVKTVLEINRGKVNGVQNSLNMLFDMTKFVLVLIWPLPNQFGLLVLLSVASVGIGNIFYIIFALSQKCKIDDCL